jgi:CRISPR/Cas system-associated protein Cas10 (large subunit of type III CRISPR-Cas system)
MDDTESKMDQSIDKICNVCDRSPPDVSFAANRKTCTSCRNKQAILNKAKKAETLPNHQICSGCYKAFPKESMKGLKTCAACRKKSARNDARPERRDYLNQ